MEGLWKESHRYLSRHTSKYGDATPVACWRSSPGAPPSLLRAFVKVQTMTVLVERLVHMRCSNATETVKGLANKGR